MTQVDLAGVRELQGSRREVVRRHPGQQLAGVRAHHTQHAPQRRHIRQHRLLVGVDVATDPIGIAHGLGRAGDEQEALARGISRQAHDSEVTLEAAACVEQAGVDHAAHWHIHIVGTQPLQHRQGVAPLQQELAEGGLVIDRHGLARGALLLDHPVQPARAAERVGRTLHARWAEVVHPLPAVLAAELGAPGPEGAGAGGRGVGRTRFCRGDTRYEA